jgi:hypothetical protein
MQENIDYITKNRDYVTNIITTKTFNNNLEKK